MDVEVPDKPSGGSEAGPSSSAGWVIFVMAFPRELSTRRAIARAIAHVEEALERSEDDLAVRGAPERDVCLFDKVEERVVPGVHLDNAPASGKSLGKGGDLRH